MQSCAAAKSVSSRLRIVTCVMIMSAAAVTLEDMVEGVGMHDVKEFM